jgi:hypothetical protein
MWPRNSVTQALPALTTAFAARRPVLRRMYRLAAHLLRSDGDRTRSTSRSVPSKFRRPEVRINYRHANFALPADDEAADVAPDSVWLHQAAGEANGPRGRRRGAARYRQPRWRRAAGHPVPTAVLLEHWKRDGLPMKRSAPGIRGGAGADPRTRTPPTSWRRSIAAPASSNPRARCSSRPSRIIRRPSTRGSGWRERWPRSTGRADACQ